MRDDPSWTKVHFGDWNRVARHLIFLNAFIDPDRIVGIRSERALCIPPFQGADRGGLGRNQATSAMAALSAIVS